MAACECQVDIWNAFALLTASGLGKYLHRTRGAAHLWMFDGRDDTPAAHFGSSRRRSRASLLADPTGYVGSALLFSHRFLNVATRPDR